MQGVSHYYKRANFCHLCTLYVQAISFAPIDLYLQGPMRSEKKLPIWPVDSRRDERLIWNDFLWKDERLDV
jgi:hypothetical protein